MGTKVKHCIRLEHLLKEGVVGSKAMVRRCRSAEEQPHRVALISEGRLDSNEDISILLSID